MSESQQRRRSRFLGQNAGHEEGPAAGQRLEAMYKSATLRDWMLGHGEPIRVRQGERVLFRLLNARGNMGISLALSGHRINVIAVDGNPVPTPATVDAQKLNVRNPACRLKGPDK